MPLKWLMQIQNAFYCIWEDRWTPFAKSKICWNKKDLTIGSDSVFISWVTSRVPGIRSFTPLLFSSEERIKFIITSRGGWWSFLRRGCCQGRELHKAKKKKKKIQEQVVYSKSANSGEMYEKKFRVFLILCFYNKGEQKKVVGIQKV